VCSFVAYTKSVPDPACLRSRVGLSAALGRVVDTLSGHLTLERGLSAHTVGLCRDVFRCWSICRGRGGGADWVALILR